MQIFDTRAVSRAPLSSEAIGARAKWMQVPEDTTTHKFKGDVVLVNGKLALALRRQTGGAELYTLEERATTSVIRELLEAALPVSDQ